MDELDDTRVIRSNGNIFADLGLENADDLKLKAKLTHLVNRIIARRHWTQKQAAEVLGIKQPDISALLHGKRLEHYSIERLMLFLGKLEQNVVITITSDDIPYEKIIVSGENLSELNIGR